MLNLHVPMQNVGYKGVVIFMHGFEQVPQVLPPSVRCLHGFLMAAPVLQVPFDTRKLTTLSTPPQRRHQESKCVSVHVPVCFAPPACCRRLSLPASCSPPRPRCHSASTPPYASKDVNLTACPGLVPQHLRPAVLSHLPRRGVLRRGA